LFDGLDFMKKLICCHGTVERVLDEMPRHCWDLVGWDYTIKFPLQTWYNYITNEMIDIRFV